MDRVDVLKGLSDDETKVLGHMLHLLSTDSVAPEGGNPAAPLWCDESTDTRSGGHIVCVVGIDTDDQNILVADSRYCVVLGSNLEFIR